MITDKPKQQGFFKRWKKGIQDLSASQLAQARISGIVGSIFGIIFATYYLYLNGLWYLTFFMAFTIIIQLVDLANALQTYWQAKELEEQMKAYAISEGGD